MDQSIEALRQQYGIKPQADNAGAGVDRLGSLILRRGEIHQKHHFLRQLMI